MSDRNNADKNSSSNDSPKSRSHPLLADREFCYRSLFEATVEILIVHDGHHILEVNPAFEVAFGYVRDEIVGSPLLICIAEKSRDIAQRNFDAGDPHFETEVITKDGSIFPVEIKTDFIETGERPIRVVTVRDIRKQRSTEVALEASEARFEAFFESVSEALLIIDRNHRIVRFNRSAENTFGYTREEIIGQPLTILVPDRFQDVHGDHVESYFSAPASRPMGQLNDLSARRKDGSEFPADISLSFNETTQETVAFIIDITERKRFQEQLAQRVEQLTTLRRIDAGLAEHLDVEYVLNMALESSMQLSGAEAGFISLFDDQNQLRLAAARGDYGDQSPDRCLQEQRGIITRVVKNRKPELITNVNTDPDYLGHRPHIISQMAIPLVSGESSIGALNLETSQPDTFNEDSFALVNLIAARIGTAIDNAGLHRQTEAQLEQLQVLYDKVSQLEQLKTDMIRIAAHDLRTPLSAILGNAEMIAINLEKTEATEDLPNFISNIRDAVYRMRGITSDILSLERIEEAAHTGVFVPFDLTALVQEIYQESSSSALIENRQMQLTLPDEAITILGDAVQLREAINNLISNAIKYTPPDGTIDVHLNLEESAALFEVKDNGFGIRKKQQGNLFKPFYRARTSETVDIEGTGLGLHLVKNIVERHNGHTYFKSKHRKGSTFGFRLPLAEE